MARLYTYGYLSISTNKYSQRMYGSGFEYGTNTPPPTPEDLTVEDYPVIVDQTPTFSWTNPTFSWTLPYGDGDPITYELQISFNDDSFEDPAADTDEFSSPGLTYTLAPEFTLGLEGTYFARIRSTDGYTYSDWSDSLEFILYFFSPYPPTIDTVTSPADDFWQVITGTKESTLYIFIRNNEGEWLPCTYPEGIAGTTWQYNMPLVSGENFIQVISAIINSTEGGISKPVEASIYLILSAPEAFNVWNYFDELGLLLSLPRIPGEINSTYKDRLIDVYTNPANATLSGLKYGISRGLGLSYSDITIEKLSDLADIDYSGNLLNDENNAIGTKLEDYADEVHVSNPIFFGNIVSDEGYWDSIDEESTGYSYLPHLWDPSASGIYSKWQSGGIGDNDDLWVGTPTEVWNPGISGYSWYMNLHTGYFYAANPSGVFNV